MFDLQESKNSLWTLIYTMFKTVSPNDTWGREGVNQNVILHLLAIFGMKIHNNNLEKAIFL